MMRGAIEEPNKPLHRQILKKELQMNILQKMHHQKLQGNRK